jgi:hypothetical protein
MLRNILSVVLAVIVAIIVFTINEHFLHQQFPLPSKLNLKDTASLALFVAMMPTSAFIMIYAGWIIGSILAGTIVKFVTNSSSLLLPIAVGAILTLFGIFNFVIIPHPTWFVVLSLISYIPAVLLGYGYFKFKLK